jgi:hypothetical protein
MRSQFSISRKETIMYLWRRWGAVYILIVLFIASWAGQFYSQLLVAQNEAMQHGEALRWSDFWPDFFQATFENWQSEWLQLIFQAVLIAALAPKLFRADHAADKEDIERIIDEVRNNRKAEDA